MRLAFLLLALPALAGCDSGADGRADVSSTRVVQRPYVPVPPGTVPRGAAAYSAALAPPGPEVTPRLIRRGEDLFLAFCSPCHGERGQGDGTVAAHGFPRPPSFRDERIRELSPAQIVLVITQGKGPMYPYADRVRPTDRWAIAHYVKRLQAQADGPASGQGQARP